MNVLSILVPLLAGVSVSAYSELLRGSHNELQPRRLDDGPCTDDGDCNNGKCHSIEAGNGKCKCKNGWSGDSCDEPQCGSVDDCGDHGVCKKDECDCDDKWEGDECDIEMEFEAVVVVVAVSSQERSSLSCHHKLDDFATAMYDWPDQKWLDLDTVNTIYMQPGDCGDEGGTSSSDLERAVLNLNRNRNLGSSHHRHHSHHSNQSRSKGHHKHPIGIVMTVSLFDATERCVDEIEDAVKKVKKWKTKDLEDLEDMDDLIDLDNGGCNKEAIERTLKDKT